VKDRPLERWLSDEHADPELRQLLEAGSKDRPRTQSLRVAPLAISSLLTIQAASAAAAPVVEGAARKALTTVVLKWFAGGVLVSATALSVSQALEPAPRQVTAKVQPALPAARPRAGARPATTREIEPASVGAEVATEPSAGPVKLPAVRADVAREVAVLDVARVALLQGNAQRALDTLAGLERMPSRSLLPEATVLRVRALLALNNVQTAREVASRFVATAPGSPQAPVLRGLFAEPLETK
jgi:hypothetical protein